MQLNCPIMNYHWGKKGSSSIVAQLKHKSDSNFTINEDLTYAELWMGTHTNGPAVLKDLNTSLYSWLKENPSALGEKCLQVFGSDIPFLMKVLSIDTPLSIQVHPSKKEAVELNASYPHIYTDANHKPEIAIALSDFQALCGFRPAEEIANYLIGIPELQKVIGDTSPAAPGVGCIEEMNYIKKYFKALMVASKSDVEAQLSALLRRLNNSDDRTKKEYLYDILSSIHGHYPGDVGCFCIYFFNYLVLKPGESVFIGAGEPHAYISGDCIECMAQSDNVIRAGLTPKLRDVEMLCKILNYSPSRAKSKLLAKVEENDYSSAYEPPTPEFAVCRIEIPKGHDYTTIPRNSPSIFIAIEGSGTFNEQSISEGEVFFVGANEDGAIRITSSAECDHLLIFQAYINSNL